MKKNVQRITENKNSFYIFNGLAAIYVSGTYTGYVLKTGVIIQYLNTVYKS